MELVATVILFLLMFTVIIAVHEFGHYLTARLLGMKVLEFAFGFPPRIAAIRHAEIDYSINAIPFGGFVRILGQDDFAIRQAGEGAPGSFTSKPWWAQAIVLAAGVTMNMVLALFVLTIAFATGTTGSTGDVRVRSVAPDSPALGAGIQVGDIVRSIDGRPITRSGELVSYVTSQARLHPDQEVTLEIERNGRPLGPIKAVPRTEPPEGEGPLGIGLEEVQGAKTYALPEAFREAVSLSGEVIVQIAELPGQLLAPRTGQAAPSVGGPIEILRVTGQVAQYGISAFLKLVEEVFPPDHPYHWPVIGSMEDLSRASYDDVVQFFKSYYGPNNTSLVVAGDIDPVETRRLVEKWFSDVKPTAPVPPLSAPPVVLTAEKRVTLEDQVQLPRLYVAWPSPRLHTPGDEALDVLSRVLASGKNSRLYKRLVYDLQIAQDVSAFQNSGPLGSAFILIITAREGHGLTEVEKVVGEELAKVKNEPPSARELERAVNQIESAFYGAMERVGGFGGKADRLNAYEFYAGRPDYFAETSPVYTSLDPKDLQAAATITSATTGGFPFGRPEGKKALARRRSQRTPRGSPPLFSPSSFVARRPDDAAAGNPDRSKPPALGPSGVDSLRFRSSGSGTASRPSRRVHEVPVVQVNVVVRAGAGADPQGKPGLASLTADMLDEGAGSATALQISDEVDFLGANLSASAGWDATRVGVHVPVKRVERALAILADVVTRRFRPPS